MIALRDVLKACFSICFSHEIQRQDMRRCYTQFYSFLSPMWAGEQGEKIALMICYVHL